MSAPFLTPDEYLEIERKAEFRSEYYQGAMYAMAGANHAHSLVVVNVIAELGQQLRSRPCRLYGIDMRVRVGSTGLYTYPDVMAVSGKSQFVDDERDILLNPTVIVEVLSASTEAYDRGLKFALYRSIESLREYVLVATEQVHVDLFRLQLDGVWGLTSARSVDDVIDLRSIDCRLKVADLYEKVEFEYSNPRLRAVTRS